MKKTENVNRLGAHETRDLLTGWLPGLDVEALTNGEIVEYPRDVQRPRTRGECRGGERPCPWAGCRYHLAIDVNEDNGSIKFNHPNTPIEEMTETCALDVADRVSALPIELDESGAYDPEKDERLSLGEFARIMGLSYDHAWHVCDEAVQLVRRIFRRRGLVDRASVRKARETRAIKDKSEGEE
jgi:hypothetical protein